MASNVARIRLGSRFFLKTTRGSMRCLKWLTFLGTAAIGGVQSTASAEGLPTSLSVTPATRAKATVEFYEGDLLEAAIDIVTFLPGEQGNGLAIGFSQEALGAFSPSTGVIGNAEAGYTIQINVDTYNSRFDTFNSVSYDDIKYAIGSIAEVTASFSFLATDSVFEPLRQDAPPFVVLSGGADAVVPEPVAGVMAALLCVLLGSKPCRVACHEWPRQP